MKTLAEQLHAALKAKNWSVPQLLKATKWKIDRTSLQRKLSGDQKLSTEEAEEIAEILGCTLVWVPEEERAS